MTPLQKWIVLDKLARKDWVDTTTDLDRAPDILSIRRAAQLLGVSKDTIHRAIRRGELPSSRIGGRVLIEKKALLANLQSNRSRPVRVM